MAGGSLITIYSSRWGLSGLLIAAVHWKWLEGCLDAAENRLSATPDQCLITGSVNLSSPELASYKYTCICSHNEYTHNILFFSINISRAQYLHELYTLIIRVFNHCRWCHLNIIFNLLVHTLIHLLLYGHSTGYWLDCTSLSIQPSRFWWSTPAA